MAGTRSIEESRVRVSITAKVKNLMADAVADASVVQGVTLQSGTLASGTEALQADRAWGSTFDIADSGTQLIDLYDFGSLDIGGGAGKDALGQTMALAEIVGIVIYNRGPGHLEVDDTISQGFDTIGAQLAGPRAMKQGGFFCYHDPQKPAMTVADGSDHMLELTARSGYGPLTCEVHLIGRSA